MSYKTISTLSIALATLLTLSACNNTATVKTDTTSPTPVITSTSKVSNDIYSSWSYAGESGPDHWADLEGNQQCKLGKEQSPINITEVMQSTNQAPKPNYMRSDIGIEDNGHTIVFKPKNDNNTTVIDGESYNLIQFHYHIPSEHQISGINYPGELHFVHANKQGELAVIGVMVNPTSMNNTSLHSLFLNGFDDISSHKSVVNGFDLSTLLPTDTEFYNYSGSLTTPPCSEHVKWFVASKPLSISQQEIQSMKQLYDGNNRPIQPIENREVKLVK
ncbi:carbonic anhydrase family protein [Psychrobacter sp.]|uniref:carbonic anhydrase n=1 Tax=Psychrobacter sp. TaxID=56811 RepID=UPI0025CFC958|nr:carbonic anhydrase family protein [Psychrobacter sp.]